MVGHELAVEQGEACEPHPRDQPGKRHFRRIRAPRYHGFAEKGLPQRHAIKAADQLLAIPHLDRMGKAAGMKIGISALDFMIDPGRGPVGRRFRA